MNNTFRAVRSWSKKNNDIAALPFILIAVVVFMTFATSGRFLSPGNFNTITSQLPALGMLALAVMIIILTGGIDLSTISTANLVSVVMAVILTKVLPAESDSGTVLVVVILAIFVGLLLSLILGLVNGILVAHFGLPAMLATLGTMIFYEGLTLAITTGRAISGFPDIYTGFTNAKLLGVPLPLIVFCLAAVAIAIVLRRTPFGKYLFMIGSSETATKFSAINTKMVLVKAYVLSGLLSGIAGMIMMSRFNTANARQGASLQLLSILIAVLGGTDPNGGFGKVGGIVLALVTLQVITSGLNQLGVSQFMTFALWGILLVAVIAYRYFMTRERRARS